jgi:pyruvate kinase
MSRITSGLPIYSLSRHAKTLNKTAIYRGVYPVLFDSSNVDHSKLSDLVLKEVLKMADLKVNDSIIFTHGDLMETVGATNTLKILKITKAHLQD